MYKRLKLDEIQFDVVDERNHPEHQTFDTSVSYYLRKYGTGQVEALPTDTRSEVKDERSVDEMMSDNSMVDHMATDDLDVLMELERKSDDFKKAFEDIELTKKQSQEFQKAVKVLDDPNASYDAKRDAYAILESLEGKVTKNTRARV